jgi:hypothetical protein
MPGADSAIRTRPRSGAPITRTQPLPLDPAIDSGATVTTTARAALTRRGRTHLVTITLTAHRDGTAELLLNLRRH